MAPIIPRAATFHMETPPSTPTKDTSTQQPRVSALRSPLQSLRRLRRRRTRSAPPKLRTSMIDQHFRVDADRKVVLPGVPKHEEDWYRDTHDFFNLVVLIPIVALNVMCWNWDKLLNLKKKDSLADAWTGDYFDAFFACTATYFLSDLIWIAIVPSCVKSPATIVQHHLATLLYILIPYFDPETRWCMGACMIVEINTWFLIARRVFNKAGFPPWIIDLSFISIRVKLISICFYITWISIRCILYPFLMTVIFNIWMKAAEEKGRYFVIEIVPVFLHAIFCGLNLKWSYDLLMSKVRYYKRRAMYQNKGGTYVEDSASKGL